MPERELSSYVGGTRSTAALDSVTAGESSEEAVSTPLDAGVEPPPRLEPLDASPSSLVDAAPAPTLACQENCTCVRRGDSDYMFCGEALTYEQAGALCGAAGGALASVEDEDENAWLSERMQALEADDFWLSGTDAEQEGVWRWSDGRVFFDTEGDAGAPFAPWDPGQPNDLNGEDCMRSTDGVWRDLDCTEELSVVCEA